MENKIYIGDSVYIERREYGSPKRHREVYDITLTTENGMTVSNTIVMEPEVLQSFFDVVKRWKEDNSV